MIKVTIDSKAKTLLIEGDVFPVQTIPFTEWDEWISIDDENWNASHDLHVLYDEDGLNINIYPLISDGEYQEVNTSVIIKPTEVVVLNAGDMLLENGIINSIGKTDIYCDSLIYGNQTIDIPVTQSELEELQEGKRFTWTFPIEGGEPIIVNIFAED